MINFEQMTDRINLYNKIVLFLVPELSIIHTNVPISLSKRNVNIQYNLKVVLITKNEIKY